MQGTEVRRHLVYVALLYISCCILYGSLRPLGNKDQLEVNSLLPRASINIVLRTSLQWLSQAPTPPLVFCVF
jgi:hypothetical protein